MLAALFLFATPFEDASGFTLNKADADLAIANISNGGAADDAGLKALDLLVHVDGKAVTGSDPSALSDYVKQKGGTVHHIVVKRDGKKKLLTLRLKQPVT